MNKLYATQPNEKLDSITETDIMHITNSYLGTTRGKFRCLFFLLLEDYIEAQSQFVRDLDLALERFARRMGQAGVLVRPFAGDIESTRSHVLDKPWTQAQRSELYNTPGLLMIEVDFDTFDPQQHRWLYVSLGSRLEDRHPQINKSHTKEFAEVLTKLAEATCDADVDPFDAASAIMHEVRFPDVAKVFEAKPGIFGFSIDLVQGAALIHRLWLKLTKEKYVLTANVDSDGWMRCPSCGFRFTIRDKNAWDGQRHKRCGTYLLPVGDKGVQ
jgi:hypothetical protein